MGIENFLRDRWLDVASVGSFLTGLTVYEKNPDIGVQLIGVALFAKAMDWWSAYDRANEHQLKIRDLEERSTRYWDLWVNTLDKIREYKKLLPPYNQRE